jgi:probable rRNA maturation factor
MKKNNITAVNYTVSKIILRDIFRSVEFYEKISKRKFESMNISFVGDEEMEDVNMKHLSHKGSTDILTFDYSTDPDSAIDGELIICVDEAKRHSKEYAVTLKDELFRLIFHGLLHLTGYDDTDARKRKAMKTREDEVLALWKQYNLKKSK